MPCELGTHERVVSFDQGPPRSVTELCGLRGAVHDIGEQDGREEPVKVRDRPRPGSFES